MLLAVDVGNTQTVFGLFDGSDLAEHWRIATERHRSGDELGAQYKGFLDLGRVDGSPWPRPCRSSAARTTSSPGATPAPSYSSSDRASRPASSCGTTSHARSAPTGLQTPSPQPTATGRRASTAFATR